MNLPSNPRVNRWVRGGPTLLRTWLTVLVNPNGVIRAAAGTIAVNYIGTLAWINTDGALTWAPLAWSGLYDPLGAAAAVQGNLTTHIGLTGTAVHGLGTAAVLTAAAANGAATLGADGVVPPEQLTKALLLRTLYFPAGSGTHTFQTKTRTFWLQVIGGGGAGGGGISGAAGSCSCGSGGGGGGYASGVAAITVTGGGTCAYVVGAGGAGVSAGVGGNGADSTLTYDGVVRNGNGGTGGNLMPTGTVISIIGGGQHGSATGANVVISGSNGEPAIRLSGTVAQSGAGGATHMAPFSGCLIVGGPGTPGPGTAGARHGGGGTGAVATSTGDQAGGAGRDGAVIIWEFS